jgi:cyanobactin cluster PatC/TenC/TruC protein
MAKSSKKEQKAPIESAIEYVLTFDGQNDFITCPEGIITPSYTKEAWIKLAELSANQSYNILSGRYHAFFMPNGLLSAGHNDQWGLVKDTSPSPANTWLHMAVTYDSQTKVMCLYRAGNLVGKADDVPPVVSPDPSLLIGSHVSQSLFKGQIAEVQLWNKVLSQTEIQSNLSGRLVGNEPGLVSYWPLNEGSGPIVRDHTPNAYNGIIHGNPSWEVSTLTLAAAPSSIEPLSQPTSQHRQKVLVFDAISTPIAVGSGALRPQGRFTIEAWVNPAANTGKQIIFADGEAQFYLEGGELKFQSTLSSEPISSSGAGLKAGTWHHVAVSRSGARPGSTQLYLNGAPNDNKVAILAALNLGGTYLGGQPDLPEAGWQGKLLEVRVWRHSRSPAEIQKHMLYFLTGRELGLARCWAIDEGFGNTIVGKTTTRAVGTIAGEAVWQEAETPIKVDLNAKERLTRSTGLADYAFWYAEMAKQQQTGTPPTFRRGRIWA